MSTTIPMRLPRVKLLDVVRKSGLLTPDDLVAFFNEFDPSFSTAEDPIKLATLLVRKKLLTKYQAMQLLQGRTNGFRLGRYTILSGIRQDRVGLVFQALDNERNRKVSLKVLPTDRVSDPTVFEAFVKEVRAAVRVQHPNIARIYDMGTFNGTHFVVSEFVDASTLDKVLNAVGPLDAHVAMRAAAQIAVALKYSSQEGVVHRDIKPANIAVLMNGTVKLLDLGLTHLLENPWKHVTRRIKTSEFAEEIAHVAPEQAWGCEPDSRSDIYSLGSTTYTLMTGQHPFPGSATEAMARRQVEGVPAPSRVRPGIPREFDEIVQKMAAREPSARYQTVDELLLRLHPWLPVAQWQELGIEPERFVKRSGRMLVRETVRRTENAWSMLKRLFTRR